MRTSFVMGVTASILLLGCSDTTFTAPSSIEGQWILHETIPGNFFGMSLVSAGSAISGTGSFQGEAGVGGTSTVVGTIGRGVINLDFTLVSQLPDGPSTSTAHFSGELLFGKLLGTLQFGAGTSGAAQFERNH